MKFIIIALIVLFCMYAAGVFRKEGQCRHCGKILKGTEQHVFRYDGGEFILCSECNSKIHLQIRFSLGLNWTYSDYTDYLVWEEETREERAQFDPDFEYGYKRKLMVDTKRKLFRIGAGRNDGLVFRFADLKDYELNF